VLVVIKVWCLPPNQAEDDLNRLHRVIVEAVTSVTELGLQGEDDLICLFPPDLMEYGLRKEIAVEINTDGLFENLEQTQEVYRRLRGCVRGSVQEFYPEAKVRCFVAVAIFAD